MPLENAGGRFNGIAQEQAGGDKLYRGSGLCVLKRSTARSIAVDLHIAQTPYFLLLHGGDMYPQLFIKAKNSIKVNIIRYGTRSA